MNNPESTCAAYSDAVLRKDLEAFAALYDEHVVVFDMWDSWAHNGLAAWRGAVKQWFDMVRPRQIAVTFDQVRVESTDSLATLSAFVKYADMSETGEEIKSISNRLSWVMRKTGKGWAIIHEHTSGPVDHATMKASVKRS